MMWETRKCTRCSKIESSKKDRCSKCGGLAMLTDEKDVVGEETMKELAKFFKKKAEAR